MTPRQRVECILRGDMPDKVPLTMYECMIPQCTVERELRNQGMCIVYRGVNVFRTHTPNVKHRTENLVIDGAHHVRTITETPAGTLTEIARPAGFTSWRVEKPFKGPDDYKVLRFLVDDERYEENYAEYRRMDEYLGEDFILRAGVGACPLHHIMIHWMGVETFAVEWAERRDEIDALCEAMAAKRREVYPLLADSPASHANYGGNEVPEVMGVERFAKYCVPLYNEAAEVLHKGGVLLGSHLDGNNTAWARLVAQSGLDYVEAFTPPPDCDLSVRDALDRWPGKFLWLNFPSSIHLASVPRIEEVTRELIGQAAPGNRFIIGITEDIPHDRWQESMLAISRTIEREGHLPIGA
jgi:hypothetical protein